MKRRRRAVQLPALSASVDSAVLRGICKLFSKNPASAAHVHQRCTHLEALHPIVASPAILIGYVLPNDPELLRSHHDVLKKIVGEEPLALKREAIEMQQHPDLFRTAKAFPPDHPIGRVISLSLLETLQAVRRTSVALDLIETYEPHWMAAANHFGLWQLRYALEDALFLLRDPRNYHLIASLLRRNHRVHERLFQEIRAILLHYLHAGMLRNAQVHSRQKNIFGVYQKMHAGCGNINHIRDVFGFRIITDTVEDCYAALRILHRLWPQHREHLKDYIRRPKSNGYQSIHTTVTCLEGQVVEFQIRTAHMDSIARYGTASHAVYKTRMGRSLSVRVSRS